MVTKVTDAAKGSIGFLRKHKKKVHLFNLGAITIGLLKEIHPLADFGFLILSILCEIDGDDKKEN